MESALSLPSHAFSASVNTPEREICLFWGHAWGHPSLNNVGWDDAVETLSAFLRNTTATSFL